MPKPNQHMMTTGHWIKRAALLSALTFFGVGSSFSWAATPGTAAANFLKIGVGARGAAMGEAQVAVADDVTAAYWNPAGLSRLRYQEFSLMHYSLFEGARYQQASYGMPTDTRGTFAFGVSLLDYGSIQGYDVNAAPTSNVDASNLLASVGWGKQVSTRSKLSVGANLKYLQSKLAGYKANGAMADFGASYPFEDGQFRGLTLAAALRNMGQSLKYNGTASSLPRQIVVGAGYAMLGGNLNLGLDAIKPNDNDSYVAAGAEYRLFDILRLRVGYNSKSNFVGNGISYGMGLRFNTWNIDYALVPFGDLGNTNRVSVGIRFGHAIQMVDAGDQVDAAYRKAQQELALGHGVKAYSMLNDLLLIAPWHKPSVELKARIEKQFGEMSASKNRARMDAEIADAFTAAKEAFDRDELVQAKAGFETILRLQPDHIGSKVYLDRIQNRYAALAQEAFKEGMAFFAAGDYEKAKASFEKTLSIDPNHSDAKAQLEKTKQVMADSKKREEEMRLLAGAGAAYKEGLAAYQKNDFETALTKFEETHKLSPEYEEVGRYISITKKSLSGVLFEQSQVNYENGQYAEAVTKLKRAYTLTPEDPRVKPALDSAEQELHTKNNEESKRLYQQGLEAYLGGDTKNAEKNWKRSLELNPENDDALKAITKLEEQKAHESKKDQ